MLHIQYYAVDILMSLCIPLLVIRIFSIGVESLTQCGQVETIYCISEVEVYNVSYKVFI